MILSTWPGVRHLVGAPALEEIEVEETDAAWESLKHPKLFSVKGHILLALYDMAYDEDKMFGKPSIGQPRLLAARGGRIHGRGVLRVLPANACGAQTRLHCAEDSHHVPITIWHHGPYRG